MDSNTQTTPEQSAPVETPVTSAVPTSTETPAIIKNISSARANGASWDEINSALSDKRAEAQAKGISSQEFNTALGLPSPPANQQYFSMKDIANHSARAFLDYPQAAWESLKTDWNRMMAPMHEQVPDGFMDQVKQQFDSTIAAGKIPLDVFNTAISPLVATYGAVVARPLSMGETNLEAMVKAKLEDKITDPDTLKAWQAASEDNLNTALLALGPEGNEISLAARAKTSPMIMTKDTLDAATAVVGKDGISNLGTVANNLHDNWVKTGEAPLEAAKRAQSDPELTNTLHVNTADPIPMRILPDNKPIVFDPKPRNPYPTLEEQFKNITPQNGYQHINPDFASDKPATPTIHEPPSAQLGSEVAGTAANEPLTGIKDFKDLFIQDPIKASGVAAKYFKDVISPASASPEAEQAAIINRGTMGEMNRATAITQAAINETWSRFGSLTKDNQASFIDYMQGRSKGAAIDPALQEPADTIRTLFKDRADQMKDIPQFAKMEFQQDYFPQNWKITDANRTRFDAFMTKQGSTAFTKAKVIPTHSEGLALGFEPRFDHPLETVMNNIRNMDRVIAHSKAINEMVDKNLAGRFVDPKEIPAGWRRLEGGLAGDHGEGASYAPPDVARIYNNSISKGFTGTPGEIFKIINGASNVLRQMKLGLFNVYHGGSTLIASMARENGLGIGELLNAGQKIKEGDMIGVGKNLAGGTARILTSPVAPIKHFMEGMKGIKEYLAPGTTDPQTQRLVDLLTKANSITHKMPDYMSEGSYRDIWDSWKRGDFDNIPHTAANFLNEVTLKNAGIKIPVALAKGVSSFMNTTMKPVFDVLVPRIKTGASMEAMQQWLEDHPNATNEQQVQAAAQIGDSMDNLMGEMIRDNLFWHKQMQQFVNLGFLSYGWVMGELRGLGSGAKDLATFQNTSNAQNIIGFVMTLGMTNSVYQYLHTGTAPATIEDLIYPQTGGTMKAGGEQVPERALLPGHTSQLTHYATDPIGELFGNESNPLLSMIHMLWTGKNWAGFDAYNRNGDIGEKTDEFSKAIWQQIEPLTIANVENGAKKGSALNTVERFAGIRQAPKFIVNPEGVANQTQYFQGQDWLKAKKFEQSQKNSYENPD